MAAVKGLPVVSLLFSSLALGLYSGSVLPHVRALDRSVQKIHERDERGLAEHFAQARERELQLQKRLDEQSEKLDGILKRLEAVERKVGRA